MIDRQKWTDHTFNLDIDPGWAHNILSRIEDTAIRLEHHCSGLSDEELSYGPVGKWSIKEHIGHLTDLEDIFKLRFTELAEGKEELTAADMSNEKTESAQHNHDSLATHLSNFKKQRAFLIKTFLNLSEEDHEHSARHTRLDVAMKPVDLLFFVAEHDDHHIQSIVEIKKKIGK